MHKSTLLLLLMAVTIPEAQSQEAYILRNNEKACFERTYPRTHFVAHPKQQVKWLRLEHPASKDADAVYAELLVKFRDDARTYSAWGGCGFHEDEGNFVCTIDGDGGTYNLINSRDGHLIIKPNSPLLMEEDEHIRRIQPEQDHQAFSLQPVPDSRCRLKEY